MKTSKLRVTDFCDGNSPVTVEFPAQRASDAENVTIWWRHHEITIRPQLSMANVDNQEFSLMSSWDDMV